MNDWYCPVCKFELVTDQPHQLDWDAYCAWCDHTWNIDHIDCFKDGDDNTPCPEWFNDVWNKHYGD